MNATHGPRVRELREYMGVPDWVVARQAHVALRRYRAFEVGRWNPSDCYFERITRALGARAKDFWEASNVHVTV